MYTPHAENELLGWGPKHIVLLCSGKCGLVFKRLPSQPEKLQEKHRSSALSPCYFQRRGAMPLPRVKQSLFPVQMFGVVESCEMHGLVSQLCRKTLLKML